MGMIREAAGIRSVLYWSVGPAFVNSTEGVFSGWAFPFLNKAKWRPVKQMANFIVDEMA